MVKSNKISNMARVANDSDEKRGEVLHIRLSKQTLAGLEAEAAKSDQKLASFVRNQLEGVLEMPEILGTVALLDAICPAVDAAQSYFGDWRQDRFAYEVVRVIVDRLLERQKPAGEPVPHPIEDNLADLFFGADATPDSAAKTIMAMTLATAARRTK
jgi:hypothetical protein